MAAGSYPSKSYGLTGSSGPNPNVHGAYMPFTSYEAFDDFAKEYQAYEDYEAYLRELRRKEEEDREKLRRIMEDPDYAKLFEERYDTGQESLGDNWQRTAENLRQGIKSADESIYKQWTDAYDAYSYLAGADFETREPLIQARKDAAQMLEEEKLKGLGEVDESGNYIPGTGIRGGPLSAFAYEAGQAAMQEAPFLAISGGTGKIISGAASQIMKSGAKKELAKAATAMKGAPMSRVSQEYALKQLGESTAKQIAARADGVRKWGSVSTMGLIHGPGRKFGTNSAENYDIWHPQVLSAIVAQNRDGQWSQEDMLEMADEQTREIVTAPAMAAGAATTALVIAYGATGVEALFAGATAKITTRTAIRSLGAGFGFEFTEEGADQFIEQVIEKHQMYPDRPWEDIMAETWYAAALGGVVGVKYSGIGLAFRGGLQGGRSAIDFEKNRKSRREFFIEWLEENSPHTDEVIKKKAAELAEGVAGIEEKVGMMLVSAATKYPSISEVEAEEQVKIDRMIDEDQAAELAVEGIDTPSDHVESAKLEEFFDNGVDAAKAGTDPKVAEEFAAEILESEGVEAVTKWVEGYNSAVISEEEQVKIDSEQEWESRVRDADEQQLEDIEAPVDEAPAFELEQEPVEGVAQQVIDATELHKATVERYGPSSPEAQAALDDLNLLAKKKVEEDVDAPAKAVVNYAGEQIQEEVARELPAGELMGVSEEGETEPDIQKSTELWAALDEATDRLVSKQTEFGIDSEEAAQAMSDWGKVQKEFAEFTTAYRFMERVKGNPDPIENLKKYGTWTKPEVEPEVEVEEEVEYTEEEKAFLESKKPLYELLTPDHQDQFQELFLRIDPDDVLSIEDPKFQPLWDTAERLAKEDNPEGYAQLKKEEAEAAPEPAAKEDPIDPLAPMSVAAEAKGWWDLLSQKNKKLAVKLVERGEDDERVQKFIESAAHKDSPAEANALEEFHNADEALRDPNSDIYTRVAARGHLENGSPFNDAAINDIREHGKFAGIREGQPQKTDSSTPAGLGKWAERQLSFDLVRKPGGGFTSPEWIFQSRAKIIKEELAKEGAAPAPEPEVEAAPAPEPEAPPTPAKRKSPADEAVFGPPAPADLRPAEEPLPTNMIPYEDSTYNTETSSFDKVEGETEYVRLEERLIKLVDVNGIKVPFYLSTGEAGKSKVPVGRWYPIFGVSPKTGWLNKGTQAQILDYYGSPALRRAAERLNREVGDIRGTVAPSIPTGKKRGSMAPNKSVDFINSALGVTALTNTEAQKKDDDGVSQIQKNIQSVVTAVDGEEVAGPRTGQPVFNALAEANDLVNPELATSSTVEGEAVALADILNIPEQPPAFGYHRDRPVDLTPLKKGEKREGVELQQKYENPKVPPKNLLVIGAHTKGTSGKGRGVVIYRHNVDGFMPSGHTPEEVRLREGDKGLTYRGHLSPKAYIRYIKEGENIQVGYYVRSAGPSPTRFVPTHTLKNSEKYEHRTPNGTLVGFKIPTSLTTGKAIVNENNWIQLPSKYSGKLDKAKSAGTPDAHLIRTFIDNIKNTVLKRQLNAMWNNGQEKEVLEENDLGVVELDNKGNPKVKMVIPPLLSLEGVASLILVANQFKKKEGGQRGAYARTLISTGKMDQLAPLFEESIKILRDAHAYTKTILDKESTPNRTVTALLNKHDEYLKLTKGFSPGDRAAMLADWKEKHTATEEKQEKRHLAFDINVFLRAMELAASLKKTQESKELKIDDVKFIDKGNAEESFEVGLYTQDKRGLRYGARTAMSKLPRRVKKLENVLAEVISEREAKTFEEERVGVQAFPLLGKSYGIEITDSNRIPLQVLIKGLKELVPNVDFSVEPLSDEAGPGSVQTVTDRIVYEVDPTQKKKTGTSYMDVTGGKGGAKVTTARGKRQLPGRTIKRSQLNIIPLEPNALTGEKLLTIRAAIKTISTRAARLKDFQPGKKWEAANNKKLKLERLKARQEFNDKLKKFWNANPEELTRLLKEEKTQLFKEIAIQLSRPGVKEGLTWAKFIKANQQQSAVGGIKKNPALTKAEKDYLRRGLTAANEKTLQEEGGSEQQWAGMLTAGRLADYATTQVKGVTKDAKPEMAQGFLGLTKQDEGPPPIKTETVHLTGKALKDKVRKYRLDGRQFYLIDLSEEGLGFLYTFNAKEATKEEYGGYGTGQDWVGLPSYVKTELQARNEILAIVNQWNDDVSVSAMSALINASLASKGQEVQQAVSLEKYEAGEAEYAYKPYSTSVPSEDAGAHRSSLRDVHGRRVTEEELQDRAAEPESAKDLKDALQKEKDENEERDENREKALKDMGLSPYTEGRVRKHGQADVAFKWEDKPQARVAMPERSQTLYEQEPEAQPQRTIEANNKGRMIPVPARYRHNNAWRKRNGLKRVERDEDGKWWYVLADSPSRQQRPPQGPAPVVTSAGEAVLGRMKLPGAQPARTATTHQERMRRTPLIQPPPTEGVVDTGRDFEGDTFELTEGGKEKVTAILNGYTNRTEFLEEMAGRLAEPTNERLALQIVKFAEAGREGQPDLQFKHLIISPAGRDALKSWAKHLSPREWQAVVVLAEEILKTASTSNRFRVRVKQAEKTAPSVPTDLPIAEGKDEVIALIERKDNGLTDEAREKALSLLREIDSELLEELSFKIGARLNVNGDTELEITGEFNSLGNIVTLAGDATTDPDALLEELAHYTVRRLPKKDRAKALKTYKAAFAKAVKKSEKVLSEVQPFWVEDLGLGEKGFRRSAKQAFEGTFRKKSESNREAAKVVLIRRMLNHIKAGQDGQLTSPEYRVKLPRIGDLVAGGKGRVGDLVSVDAEMIDDVVRATYHLSNADEFYANAIVTRLGDSTFDRARGFLKNILRAIAKVFSENARIDDFVRQALASLAKPGKRNKDMSGMLLARNIIAANMKVLSRKDRLAPAVEAKLEQIKAQTETADRLGHSALEGMHGKPLARQRVEMSERELQQIVSQASAITNIFNRLIQKHSPGLDTNSAIYGKVSMSDVDYINDLLKLFPSEKEYTAVVEKFATDGRHELAQTTALYAFQMILEMEKNARYLKEKARKKLEYIEGKEFQTWLDQRIRDAARDATIGKTRSNLVKSLEDLIDIAKNELERTGDITGILGSGFLGLKTLSPGETSPIAAMEMAVDAVKTGDVEKAMVDIATLMTTMENPEGRELVQAGEFGEAITPNSFGKELTSTSEEVEVKANWVYDTAVPYLEQMEVPLSELPPRMQAAYKIAAAVFAANPTARRHATVVSFSDEKAAEELRQGRMPGEDQLGEVIYKAALTKVETLQEKLAEGKLAEGDVANVFSGDLNLQSEEGQVAYLARYAIRSPVKAIEKALQLQAAATLAEKVVNDAEFLDYRRQVGIHARVDDVPDLLGDTFYGSFVNGEVLIPLPPTELVEEYDPQGKIKRGEDSPNVIKVRFFLSDEKDAKEQILKAFEAADKIKVWLDEELKKVVPVMDSETGEPMLDDNGQVMTDSSNISPYFNYYWNTLQWLQSGVMHDAVWNAPNDMNVRGMARNSYFGVLRQMVSGTPVRSMRVASRFVDKHEMYYVLFDSWRANHKAAWTNKLLAAARSRPGEFAEDASWGLYVSKDSQMAKGVADWERVIGRPLRESWQENGKEFDVGQTLPNGRTVTKEDMALIDYEFKMVNEAYEINDHITEIDSSVQPMRITDTTVKTLRRMAIKRGRKTLPRRFSNNGKGFLGRWDTARQDEKNTLVDIFNIVFRNDEDGFEAMVSFINDRNPEWITAPREKDGVVEKQAGSPNELLYGMVAQEVEQAGPEMEHTAEAVVKLLAERSGKQPSEIKEIVMSELEGSLTAMTKIVIPAVPDAALVTVSHHSGHSPMTDARQSKLGPSWFYSHGLNHEGEFQSFVSSLQLPLAQNVVNALRSVSTDLRSFLNKGEVTKVLEDKAKELYPKKWEKSLYRRKVLKAAAKQLGVDVGSKTNPETEIWGMLVQVDKFIKDFDDVYSEGGKEFTVELMPGMGRRAWGAMIGGILANPLTAMRNVTETAINATQYIMQLTGGTGVQAALQVIFRGLLWHSLKMGGSLAKSLLKLSLYPVGGFSEQGNFVPLLPLYSAVQAGWYHQKFKKGLRQRLKGAKPNIKGLIGGFLHPAMVELTQVLPRRIAEHNILEAQGLGMPITPRETLLNFVQLAEMGGRIMDEKSANATTHSNFVLAQGHRAIGQLIGGWESYVALYARPTMPRLGDLMANNIMAAMAKEVSRSIEAKARMAYGSRINNKVSLEGAITKEELLGNFLGLLETNQVTYNNMQEFLTHAGVTDLMVQVKNFWRELAHAPDAKARKKVRLFTPQQVNRMAAVIVMANNHPSPTNRPLWQKTSVMNSILFALTGWAFNQLQNWMRASYYTPGAAKGGRSILGGRVALPTQQEIIQKAQKYMVLAMALGIAIPDNWLLELLARQVDKKLYGKRRITSLPDEVRGASNQMKAVAALSLQSIPLVGSSIATAIHGSAGRAVHTPANLLTSQVANVWRWGAEMIETGFEVPRNKEQALAWAWQRTIGAANRALPMSRAVTSRIDPTQKALLGLLNSKRAIQANFADRKNVKALFGYGAGPNRRGVWSHHRNLFAAAVERGDLNGARRIFNEAIEDFRYVTEMHTGNRPSWDDAKSSMVSSLKQMNPIARSLRSTPTRKEFWLNLSHVENQIDGSDWMYITTSIEKWDELYRVFEWRGLFRDEEDIPQPQADLKQEVNRTVREYYTPAPELPDYWTPKQ